MLGINDRWGKRGREWYGVNDDNLIYITDIKVSWMSNINVESCKCHTTKKKGKKMLGLLLPSHLIVQRF